MTPPLRMLGGVWSAVLHRAASDRVVLAAAFVTILLAVTLLSTGPIYASAVSSNGLQRSLQDAPTTEGNVQIARPVAVDRYEEVDQRVTSAVQDVFRPTGATISRSALSGSFALPDQEEVRDLAVFGLFEGIDERASLQQGRWPTGTPDDTVPAALPVPAAAALDLTVGDTVTLTDRLGGGEVTVRVVGTYAVDDVTSVYWWDDRLETEGVSSGTTFTVHGPFVVARDAFLSDLTAGGVTARWRIAPDFDRLTVADLGTLERGLQGLDDRLNQGEPSSRFVQMDTRLPQILERAQRSLLVTRSGVLISTVQLALLAAYALLFTAGLVIEQRRVETALLRARGAAPGQVAGMALLEGLLLAVPAVIAGPPLAALAVGVLDDVGPLAAIDLRLTPEITPAVYVLAAVTALSCVAALVAPTLRSARSYMQARTALGRESGPGFVRRTGLDLALLVLAGLGYWQLRRYGTPITRDIHGTLGLDPFLILAPTIGLLAGAVVVLRLVPLLAGVAERMASGRAGLVGSLGAWQLARRPGRHTRAALMLVLALAIGLFTASYDRTWSRSQQDQADHQVGADLAVTPDERFGTAYSSLTLASAYRDVDGVEEVMPVARRSVRVAGDRRADLVAVGSDSAAQVTALRPDLAGPAAGELFAPLHERRVDLEGPALPPGTTEVRATGSIATSRPIAGPDEVRRQPMVLIVRDADGVISRVDSQRFLPDGDTHDLVFDITEEADGSTLQAAHPLTVVGIEARILPPVGQAVEATARIAEVVPVVDGRAADRLPLETVVWASTSGRLVNAVAAPEVSTQTSDGTLTMRIGTGAAPGATSAAVVHRAYAPGGTTSPVPAIANDAYVDALGVGPGATPTVDIGGDRIPVELVAAVEAFPTLDAGTPTLVLDYATLTALEYLRDGRTVTPDAWWLDVVDDRAAEVHERLEGRPFSSREVLDRFARGESLRSDPVALGIIGALSLGFVAATLFAAIGFAVGAIVSARERLTEFSLLRAVGLSPGQLTGWLSLENGAVVAFSVVGGTVLGLALSWLVLPLVSLTPGAVQAFPDPIVTVPWLTLLRIELLLVGVLVAVLFVVTRLLRRVVLASALRFGEER